MYGQNFDQSRIFSSDPPIVMQRKVKFSKFSMIYYLDNQIHTFVKYLVDDQKAILLLEVLTYNRQVLGIVWCSNTVSNRQPFKVVQGVRL